MKEIMKLHNGNHENCVRKEMLHSNHLFDLHAENVSRRPKQDVSGPTNKLKIYTNKKYKLYFIRDISQATLTWLHL